MVKRLVETRRSVVTHGWRCGAAGELSYAAVTTVLADMARDGSPVGGARFGVGVRDRSCPLRTYDFSL